MRLAHLSQVSQLSQADVRGANHEAAQADVQQSKMKLALYLIGTLGTGGTAP